MYDIIETIFAIIFILYLFSAIAVAIVSFFDPNK